MAVDSTAMVILMRGKYVVQRRGMYSTDTWKTEAAAQEVADRWNAATIKAREIIAKERAAAQRRRARNKS